MRYFHICTIANNQEQYHQFKSSLIESGFTDEKARFTLFDNFSGNNHDPYATLNSVLSNSTEPYLIYCHQDILFNKGEGFDQLVIRLNELNKIDPTWAIAGNAGVNQRYKYVIRISDANNSSNWPSHFPQKVFTLDENLLIFNLKNKSRCSTELSGFHMYGSDTCLHAIKNGSSCYVINFHVTHLSGGNMGNDFLQSLETFHRHWSDKFLFCIHKTITGKVTCLSKYSWLRSLGALKLIQKIVLFFNRFHPYVTPY